jgi:hypothetical protein
MSDEKPMGQVIQIDEARIRDHLGEMVRGTVEETLNGRLWLGAGYNNHRFSCADAASAAQRNDPRRRRRPFEQVDAVCTDHGFVRSTRGSLPSTKYAQCRAPIAGFTLRSLGSGFALRAWRPPFPRRSW